MTMYPSPVATVFPRSLIDVRGNGVVDSAGHCGHRGRDASALSSSRAPRPKTDGATAQ